MQGFLSIRFDLKVGKSDIKNTSVKIEIKRRQMEDLQQLPVDVQLHIYDLFLALRTYQHKYRTEAICKKISDAHGKLEEDHEGDEDHCWLDAFDLDIPGITRICVKDDENLRDSLPQVICDGYDIINFSWEVFMELSMCSMSLDNDDEEDARVLRLWFGEEDGGGHDALYDIQTFECLDFLEDSYGYSGCGHMVNVMNAFFIDLEERVDEIFGYPAGPEREEYFQWMKNVSENKYTIITEFDEFTKMRSLLHERCISRLSKKRARSET